jgi:hypothetical protein
MVESDPQRYNQCFGLMKARLWRAFDNNNHASEALIARCIGVALCLGQGRYRIGELQGR